MSFSFICRSAFLCAGMTAVPFLGAWGFSPAAPAELKADVNGLQVHLTWEWGDAGASSSRWSFEEGVFPESVTVKSTCPDAEGNWMVFDFSDDPENSLAHDGSFAAVLSIGPEFDDLSQNHQDEWLILKPGNGAVYLDFWYYLHPELLELGGIREFPDHYYVKISRDNGETWTEIWDGRWDMGASESLQQASVFLGEPADENTLVAFQGESGSQETLYFTWVVDDVDFICSDGSRAGVRLQVSDSAEKKSPAPEALVLRRGFEAVNPHVKAVRKVDEEWLNNGYPVFRVYDGDVLVADYLKARQFTDCNYKEPGIHTFRVMAWTEDGDVHFEEASIDVDIDDFIFDAPRNAKASYNLEENGRYSVSVSWEAPEKDVTPAYYEVFLNNKSIGWVDPTTELSLGQTGLYKGIYTFMIKAIYQMPDGTSDPIFATVAPGTVMPVDRLAATPSGNGYILSWSMPECDEKPVAFNVYRGDLPIASGIKELTVTDTDAPKGMYCYNVRAVYPDGTVSLPASTPADFFATPALAALPLKETFDNGHLPADWQIELEDPYDRVKDMYNWRFDNWFESDFSGAEGIEGGCASASGIAAGMNRLECYLVSPPFEVPETGGAVAEFTNFYSDSKPGPSGAAQEALFISTDNGNSWENILDLAATPNGKVSVSLADYAGRTVNLRWSFLSRNSGVAAIDNVHVYAGDSGIGGPADSSESELSDVYNVSGIRVLTQVSKAEISTLPAGIYIVRSGTQASRIIVR